MIDEWGKGAKYWDHAWNPVIGCKSVSEGCENCYARGMSERFPELQDAKGGFDPHPVKPKNPPRKGVVFVGNMTDLFGEWNTDMQIVEWLLSLSPNAENLILTKRVSRMAELGKIFCAPHVIWWGMTAENKQRVDERIHDFCMMTSRHRRWLSLEPLLGPIDLERYLFICAGSTSGPYRDYAGKIVCRGGGAGGQTMSSLPSHYIDWVVVGAESLGNRPGRECKIEWIESIVEQCQNANVPVFVKQLHIGGNLVKDISKFPEHLQIRQVPWKNR